MKSYPHSIHTLAGVVGDLERNHPVCKLASQLVVPAAIGVCNSISLVLNLTGRGVSAARAGGTLPLLPGALGPLFV